MMERINFFTSLTTTRSEFASWEKVMDILRGDQLRELTRKYRTLQQQYDAACDAGDKEEAGRVKAEMGAVKRNCPAVVCQVELEGGKDKTCIRNYTGTIMADFDDVPPGRMEEAIRLVTADEHTLLVYTTISGRGFRVIARMEGGVNADIYREAWLTMNEYYRKLTGLDYDPKCSDATRLCGLAYDPKAFYKPAPKRLKTNMAIDRRKARRGKGAGRPAKADNIGKKVKMQVEAEGATYTEGHHNDYVSRCVYKMNRYGVTLDDCTAWALREFDDYAQRHRGQVQSIVRSVYQKHIQEHATVSVASVGRKASVGEVERYISARYLIRLNLLSNKLEYCPVTTPRDGAPPEGLADAVGKYKELDDRFVNSIWRQMQLDGMGADLTVIHNILGSDFARPFHPFRDWISLLPEWDGHTDYIRDFFSMVHYVGISDKDFHYYTRCWFLAMVASVLYDKVVNQCILTFIGPQGTYKSTFMQYLLPPHLRAFFTTKSNAFQMTKDDKLLLAQNIIVSLEEIDCMAPREVNQLKAYTTMPSVNERPPYAHHTVNMPRVASLTATGNNLTFLSDSTGTRRWLPFHVVSIENPLVARIPYEGMYAQALALIRSDECYWLEDSDIRRLNDYNRSFMAPDPATEMIITYYQKPRTESETSYLTSTKIAARFAPTVKISPTKIGQAMADLGFEQVRTCKARFWKVAERPQCDIDSRIPGEDSKPEDLPF